MTQRNQTVIREGRFYTIATENGLCMEAAASANGNNLFVVGPYKNKPSQEWSFRRKGIDTWQIVNRACGKAVDIRMGGILDGTWLHLWEPVEASSQMWTAVPTRSGTVRFLSQKAYGKCIDTVGLECVPWTPLQLWRDLEIAGAQTWVVTELPQNSEEG